MRRQQPTTSPSGSTPGVDGVDGTGRGASVSGKWGARSCLEAFDCYRTLTLRR